MSEAFFRNYTEIAVLEPPGQSLVAYREPLLVHFRERMELLEKDGFNLHIGYEPMTHGRIKWKNCYNYEVFMPEFPNVDIAHSGNMTWKRWSQDKFRKKPKNWTESTDYTVPGWNLKKELKNIDLDKV